MEKPLSRYRRSNVSRLGTKVLNPRLPSSGAWSTELRTYLPSVERTPRAARDQRPLRYMRVLYSHVQTQW